MLGADSRLSRSRPGMGRFDPNPTFGGVAATPEVNLRNPLIKDQRARPVSRMSMGCETLVVRSIVW